MRVHYLSNFYLLIIITYIQTYLFTYLPTYTQVYLRYAALTLSVKVYVNYTNLLTYSKYLLNDSKILCAYPGQPPLGIVPTMTIHHQDNSPLRKYPFGTRELSWWGIVMVGNCPGRDLSWWGVVLFGSYHGVNLS